MAGKEKLMGAKHMRMAHVPDWTNNTYEILARKILSELDLDPYHPFALSQLNQSLAQPKSWTFFRCFPGYVALSLLYFLVRDYRAFRYEGLNYGAPISQVIIQTSLDAKAVGGFGRFIRVLHEFSVAFRMVGRLRILMKSGVLKLVLGGDCPYPEFSLSAQVAAEQKVPAYFLGGLFSARLDEFDAVHLSTSPRYEALIESFAPDDVDLQGARDRLERRVSGDLSSANVHTKMDSFLPSSRKSAIWLFLHSFHDAPGGTGLALFADYPAWIRYSINWAVRRSIPVVVRPHPESTLAEHDLIAGIVKEFDNVSLDLSATPLVAVKASDPLVILSSFGTVLREASFAGIPTIAVARSASTAFGVSPLPRTRSQYAHLLSLASRRQLTVPQQASILLAEAFEVSFYRSMKSLEGIPLVDVPEDLWVELSPYPYPVRINDRIHTIIKEDSALREWMRKALESRAVTEELGLSLES